MATDHPSEFGSLLKRYRAAAALTQEELAERARLSTRAVSDLERGARRNPYRDTVRQLADALELGAEERARLGVAARRVAGSDERSAEESAGPTVPANLPPESTSFVGRQREIAAVSSLLMQPAVRLVTLTGAGGIGKTRLAVHLAARLAGFEGAEVEGHYPVVFVPLASIGDAGLVPAAIAGALGVREYGAGELVRGLIEHLHPRRLLLVLDNFEHVLEARSLVAELLEACPDLRVLVTSREVLRLSWEHVFEVPPLPLPDHPSDVEGHVVGESEAVALFVERARSVKADFELTEENTEAVVRICRALDGMPLAIELAAARLRLFPPQALLGRLSRRLQLLTGGARDLPARHQTLRGAIDWSYELLSEEEKRLFARLSVFWGGCTFDAIDAVCSPSGDLGESVLDGVASLVEKSLLRQEGEQEPRFVMLETIREYAGERLAELADGEVVRDAHTRYYLALVEEAAAALEGPAQQGWLERLEVERDNLRAVLQRTRDGDDPERGLRLALALHVFWLVRGPLSEGRRWLESLAAAEQRTSALQTAALSAAGKLAAAEGRRRESADLVERSLNLNRALGDRRGIAEALGWLATSWYLTGDVERAFELIELVRQSEIEARESGDRVLLAVSLRLQAEVAATQRDPRRARVLGEESLALYRELGDAEGIAEVSRILADAAYGAGDRERARELADELLALLERSTLSRQPEEWLQPLAYRARMQGDYEYAERILTALVRQSEAVGDRRLAAHARTGLGLLAREQGAYRKAIALYSEGLATLREVGDLLGSCRVLVGLSDVARDQGDAEGAIALCEEARVLLAQTGDAPLTGFILHNLGCAAWFQGDHDRAEHLFEESISLFRRQQSVVDAVEIQVSMGLLALDRGWYERAGETLRECLVTARDTESRWLMGTLLEGMAGVAAAMGGAERAATLLGAAEAERLTLGTTRWLALERLYNRYVAEVVAALGEEYYLRAVERGRRMTLAEAISAALVDGVTP